MLHSRLFTTEAVLENILVFEWQSQDRFILMKKKKKKKIQYGSWCGHKRWWRSASIHLSTQLQSQQGSLHQIQWRIMFLLDQDYNCWKIRLLTFLCAMLHKQHNPELAVWKSGYITKISRFNSPDWNLDFKALVSGEERQKYLNQQMWSEWNNCHLTI